MIYSESQIQGKFFDVDGMSMHVVDVGEKTAPTLLCLHGNPTWSYYYRNVINNLKKEYRIICPDHIGMGLSEKMPHKTFRAIDRVQHLKKLLEQLEIKKFSLLMHDWGGPIGARLATELQDRVEKLIFCNTTLTEVRSLPSFIRFASGTLLGKFFTQITSGFLRTMFIFGSKKGLSKEVILNYLFPYKTFNDRKAIYDFVADIPLTSSHASFNDVENLKKLLPRLAQKPILLLWGLLDPCFHKGILQNVEKHFPKADVLAFHDASHLVLEDKAEECLVKIQEFLGK